MAGNLDEDWALPTSEDRTGNRHSIIRRYDGADGARPGTDPIGLMWAVDAAADADADAPAADDAAQMLTHLPMLIMVG